MMAYGGPRLESKWNVTIRDYSARTESLRLLLPGRDALVPLLLSRPGKVRQKQISRGNAHYGVYGLKTATSVV